jgi:hypothetical protein
VEVKLQFRALVPVINAQSAAIALRVCERVLLYEQYSGFWRVRPKVWIS